MVCESGGEWSAVPELWKRTTSVVDSRTREDDKEGSIRRDRMHNYCIDVQTDANQTLVAEILFR
jgi:hypothetical protein